MRYTSSNRESTTCGFTLSGMAVALATARAQTHAYLENLRARMREHIDSGGDILGAVDVDQSAFMHLEQFDALARRNAQAVFIEMEFD